jgi:DNA-directed RNA polymerase subunit N (RpoN/RPB10)
MIIPVKCFTCGTVLADKYRYYQVKVKEMKLSNDKLKKADFIYLTDEHTDKGPEGKVLDDLDLHNLCCRRHMLTHVDIE